MFIAIGSHPAVLVSDRKKLVSPVVRKGAKLSQAGDIPVPGDFDGDDGKLEAGVFRPLDRTWYINQTTGGPLFLQFGLDTDTPVPSLYVRQNTLFEEDNEQACNIVNLDLSLFDPAFVLERPGQMNPPAINACRLRQWHVSLYIPTPNASEVLPCH